MQVRAPDPMHTIGGEAKSVFTMLNGRTSPLSPSNSASASVYEYEAETNKRWEATAHTVVAAGASSSRGRGRNSVSSAALSFGSRQTTVHFQALHPPNHPLKFQRF